MQARAIEMVCSDLSEEETIEKERKKERDREKEGKCVQESSISSNGFY